MADSAKPLLQDWNKTQMSFFDAFLKRCADSPEQICFELCDVPAGALTFARLKDRIGSAAGVMRGSGVARGDIVLIFAQHSVGMLLAFFGAQLIGAIPAFMPPPTSRQPLEAWIDSHQMLMERIAPAMVIVEPAFMEHIEALGSRASIMSTSDLEAAPGADWVSNRDFSEDDIAFLQHSSGTTGLKKGVMVTYRQLHNQVTCYANRLAFDPYRHCVVSWLPVYHDMGLIAATLMPFVLGAPVHILDTFGWLADPGRYIDLLAEHPNSFSWLPNFAFGFLPSRCKSPGAGSLASVAAVINCSEPCKPDAMTAFTRHFASAGLCPEAVQVSYAMAEYVFAVTQTGPDAPPKVVTIDADLAETENQAVRQVAGSSKRTQSYVSVGRPLQDTQVVIGSDASSNSGTIGEIRIAGTSLCSGYYKNAGETARKFKDGWYHTGDFGFVLDGELFITGRADDLIIIRGRNIYAHDIEALVTGTGMIKDGRVVAFGSDDARSGTQELAIVAEVAEPSNRDAAERTIRETILACYGISPADIVLTQANTLIKTSSGKISRTDNIRRYRENQLVSWA